MIDEQVLERLVHVVGLAGQELVVPDDAPGIRVEREHAVRVERVAGVPALEARPRLCLGRRPVDQVRSRVVAPGRPTVAADPEHQRRVAPRVAARLARPRHRRRPPQLLAGPGVTGRDEAGHLLGLVVAFAAVGARNHLAPDDDRPRRVPEPERVVGPLDVPDHLAAAGVERDDVRVDGRQVDLVVVDGEVAGRDDAAEILRVVLVPVAPEELPGGGVERFDDAERARDVHDAVVDERVRLGPALGADRPRPDEAQPIRVLRVDLVQRAVAPPVEGAPPVDPVGRVRIEQHGVGDRRHLAQLPLRRRAREEGDAGEQRSGEGIRASRAVHRRSFQARPTFASPSPALVARHRSARCRLRYGAGSPSRSHQTVPKLMNGPPSSEMRRWIR